jgi:hypothetical protein
VDKPGSETSLSASDKFSTLAWRAPFPLFLLVVVPFIVLAVLLVNLIRGRVSVDFVIVCPGPVLLRRSSLMKTSDGRSRVLLLVAGGF